MWVTVLTIVVPAVVVLVAAYFTYQTSREVQEHAAESNREVQDRAARDTRLRGDLTELRSVLDAALTDLSLTRAAAQAKLDAWMAFRNGGDEDDVRNAQVALNDTLARTRASASRLRIRLGQQGAHNVYWFAYQEFEEAGACTRIEGEAQGDERDREKAVRFLVRTGIWLGNGFSDLAFDKAQSALGSGTTDGPSAEQLAVASKVGRQTERALLECGKAVKYATAGTLPNHPRAYWDGLRSSTGASGP